VVEGDWNGKGRVLDREGETGWKGGVHGGWKRVREGGRVGLH